MSDSDKPPFGYLKFKPEHEDESQHQAAAVLTLRDYFAAKVLEGMVASWPRSETIEHMPTVAAKCYQFADAMLKARNL